MAKQSIGIGSSANDGTGDPLRTAFDKINDNFDELYGTTAEANDLIEDATPQLGGDLDVLGRRIISARTNEDIVLLPNGTGGVLASAVRLQGTTISSDDSSLITIGEAFQVNGATNIDGAVTATSTVAVTGALTGTSGAFSTTLAVTGATTLTGALTVNNSVTAASVTTNDIASNGSNADITLDTAGTGDINLTAGADINIPANIGLTFGDDGEKIEGDGTDLTIAGNNINLTAVADIVVPANVGITFGTGEKIEGDSTSLTVTSGAAINLTATTDVVIPANVGVTFGTGEKIEGDNTNLTITSGGLCTITATGNTVITNNALVSGTLGITGLTSVAALTATGAVTLGGAVAIGDLNILADGTITTDTNGDFVVDPAGTGAIVLTGPITATGVQTTTGQLNVDNLRADGNTISATNTNGGINITPAGTGGVVLGGEIVGVTNELNAVDIEVSGVLRSNTIQSDTTDADINISSQGTGVVGISSQLTLTGSFLPAIHTFVATDAVTITEHAGRTLLLGEVGGNAAVTLTLPAATGTGAVYKFIVSVVNTSNYIIKVADATDTIDGMVVVQNDTTAGGTASLIAWPTVAASDTITLNGTTSGGVSIGDYLILTDIATNQYTVSGMLNASGTEVTPFSATVS
jgi:hypothetical protein